MKIAWKLMMVVALVAVAISCLKVEPTPQYTKSTASLTVIGSVTSVAVSATDSLSNVISFTWTDPKYAVGLDNTKFSIVVGATGQNFVSSSSKDFTGVLGGTLLGKELNAMALMFGGKIGQAVTLDVKLVAAQVNNNEQMSSNIIQVAVTPYGDLGLNATPTSVACSAANALNVGTVLTWGTAFNGYIGVKTYQLQYAKGGTSFASPTSSAVTGYTQSFTQNVLNNIALGFGTAVGANGDVDFRIKASNEQGTVLYSNVVTVTIGTFAPYNSIGLIGDFTGWGNDVDLYRPDVVNAPTNWTAVVYLTSGGVKFRYDDMWNLAGSGASTAWGGTAWPSGTGDLNVGGNIPVGAAGFYQVNFNSATAAYSFTALTIPTVTKISVIGSSTPGGDWSTDLELTQSSTNTNVWSGSVSLTQGELKFRANDTWPGSANGYNWGTSFSSPTGMSGWATQSGGNIPISKAGNYFVYINIGTGQYFFGNVDNNSVAGTAESKISLIGDFDGWPGDTSDPNLMQNPQNPYEWSAKISITAGGAKFRANHDWTTSWGGTTFPNGFGTTNSDPNIPVTTGNPQITFNSATGEYTFTY